MLLAIVAVGGAVGYAINSFTQAGTVTTLGISGAGSRIARKQDGVNASGPFVSMLDAYNGASKATRACAVAAPGVSIQQGFCWQSSYFSGGKKGNWVQQGITGNAYADGKYAGKNILLVSAYREKSKKTNGSRVAVVNLDKGAPVYTEVILATKCGSSCTSLPSHAGGLAWVNHYLYVASTYKMYVFDTDKVVAKTSKGKTSYYLPVYQQWNLQNTQKVGGTKSNGAGCKTITPKISSLAYNPTDQAIYSAEYVSKKEDCKNKNTTDVLVWNLLKDGSGLLPNGVTDSSLRFQLPNDPQNINGIGVYGDVMLMNETYGTDTVTRFSIDRSRGASDIQINSTLAPRKTPSGNGEGIYINQPAGLVWSLTENAPGPYVYSYPLSEALAE